MATRGELQGAIEGMITEALDVFDVANINGSQLWVDYAVELRDTKRPARSLYLKTRHHHKLVEVLTGKTSKAAKEAVNAWSPSTVYQKDYVSLLSSWSGFRLKPKAQYDNGVSFVQVYNTEKALTYQSSSPSKIVRLDPFEFLTNPTLQGRTFQRWADQALRVVRHQGTKNIANAVRIEVSLPLGRLQENRHLLWPSDKLLERVLEPMPVSLMA